MKKPVVVFSNFWHVESILERGFFLHRIDDKRVAKFAIDTAQFRQQYSVSSISLSHPDLSKGLSLLEELKRLGEFHRIDFFCPTYDTLMDYKKDKDWEKCRKRYLNTLRERTDRIKEWVSSLENRLYFLCCWENTSKNAKCHRQVLYDVFKNSKSIKDSVYSIYCHGNEIQKEISQQIGVENLPETEMERNVIIAQALETPEGRAQLAQAMVEPIRGSINPVYLGISAIPRPRRNTP